MENNQRNLLPLNIQMFADSGNDDGSITTSQNNVVQNNAQQNSNNQSDNYAKLDEMVASRIKRGEDEVLKSYFKTQGLTGDEMNEAIRAYKSQKEEKNRKQIEENANLQSSLQASNQRAMKAELEKEAFVQAIELGITESKRISYITKLADFTSAVNENNEIDCEKVKEAINQVLTDIPELKSQASEQAGITIGADSSKANQNSSEDLFDFGFTGVRKH